MGVVWCGSDDGDGGGDGVSFRTSSGGAAFSLWPPSALQLVPIVYLGDFFLNYFI